MKKILLATLAAASCVLGSSVAMAAYVTDYLNGVLLGTYTMSLMPTVLAYRTGKYTTVAISDGTGAAAGYSYATYYKNLNHGGLLVGDPFTTPINSGGPQSFIHGPSAPTFIPGVYVENDGEIVTIAGEPVTIRADSMAMSSVPEPATWAMMLVGFGMVGFAARRHRNVAVSYT